VNLVSLGLRPLKILLSEFFWPDSEYQDNLLKKKFLIDLFFTEEPQYRFYAKNKIFFVKNSTAIRV